MSDPANATAAPAASSFGGALLWLRRNEMIALVLLFVAFVAGVEGDCLFRPFHNGTHREDISRSQDAALAGEGDRFGEGVGQVEGGAPLPLDSIDSQNGAEVVAAAAFGGFDRVLHLVGSG